MTIETQQTYDVLIVGAGHGGAQAAIALRQRKFEGTICIVGDEPDLPYERPPLSKSYLSGDAPFDQILIKKPNFWREQNVELRLGQRVVAVNPTAHYIQLDSGEPIGYRSLVWAAGGKPRRLTCPGAELGGVHYVRTRADVDRIAGELKQIQQVVIVGGGFIGLEAAAVMTECGKRVTVLESQQRVLARVSGEPLSRFYEREHRARGVDVRTGATVASLSGNNGRIAGVDLKDGTHLPADMVIVGIGIVPSVDPLIAAGATGGDGVRVDELCRTSLPDVFALGDCAAHFNSHAGGNAIRLESVQNANDQALVVAKALTGVEQPYCEVPWFWSSQYDLKLQMVGLSLGHDRFVLRGAPEARSFSVIYLRDKRVIALDCVNATKEFVQGKALVAAGAMVAPELLADTSISLKELAQLSPLTEGES